MANRAERRSHRPVLLRGMSMDDRKLFLKLCGTLGMAVTELVRLGLTEEQTRPYIDMLKLARERMGGPAFDDTARKPDNPLGLTVTQEGDKIVN